MLSRKQQLKWLVRGWGLVFVVIAELWKGIQLGEGIVEWQVTHHRYLEKQGVFHLRRHGEKLEKSPLSRNGVQQAAVMPVRKQGRCQLLPPKGRGCLTIALQSAKS
jgi:hypothetical protein